MRKQLIGSLFAFAMAGQLWGQGLYEKYADASRRLCVLSCGWKN